MASIRSLSILTSTPKTLFSCVSSGVSDWFLRLFGNGFADIHLESSDGSICQRPLSSFSAEMPPELRAFDSVPFERFAVFAACPSVSFMVFPPVFHGGFPLVFLPFRIHTSETPANRRFVCLLKNPSR